MVMATISMVEWELRSSGRMIPRLHFQETPTVKGKSVGYVTGYSADYVATNWLGTGAIVFLDRNEQNRAVITWNNLPKFPDIPRFCKCGLQFTKKRKHLECLNEKCTHKGTAVWFQDQRITWLNVSGEFSVPWRTFLQSASAGPLRTST